MVDTLKNWIAVFLLFVFPALVGSMLEFFLDALTR
jgi:hypothetical protein